MVRYPLRRIATTAIFYAVLLCNNIVGQDIQMRSELFFLVVLMQFVDDLVKFLIWRQNRIHRSLTLTLLLFLKVSQSDYCSYFSVTHIYRVLKQIIVSGIPAMAID